MRARQPVFILAGLAILAAARPLVAQNPGPATETIQLVPTYSERLTVPVRIGERGPYAFIVDTGSERSVVALELARALGLRPGRTVTVYSLTEVSRLPTAILPSLSFGRRTVRGIQAPVISRLSLGADGLLGLDSISGRRLEIDFAARRMTIEPSLAPEETWPGSTIVVRARSRFGHLMLTDAAFEGERVYAVVDTGAQVTVANNALRRRLERRGSLGALRRIELVSVTGGVLPVEYSVARSLRIADAEIIDLPVAFADAHPFRHLRLLDRPAILLGMDALAMFERASFDFGRRRVRLLVPARRRAVPPDAG